MPSYSALLPTVFAKPYGPRIWIRAIAPRVYYKTQAHPWPIQSLTMLILCPRIELICIIAQMTDLKIHDKCHQDNKLVTLRLDI